MTAACLVAFLPYPVHSLAAEPLVNQKVLQSISQPIDLILSLHRRQHTCLHERFTSGTMASLSGIVLVHKAIAHTEEIGSCALHPCATPHRCCDLAYTWKQSRNCALAMPAEHTFELPVCLQKR